MQLNQITMNAVIIAWISLLPSALSQPQNLGEPIGEPILVWDDLYFQERDSTEDTTNPIAWFNGTILKSGTLVDENGIEVTWDSLDPIVQEELDDRDIYCWTCLEEGE